MKVYPVKSLKGTVPTPGDKSISHRYAMLGAMAAGTTRIRNFSPSHDCESTLNCLKDLGIEINELGQDVEIRSSGWRSFAAPTRPLDARNSGTTIRLISALLAARPHVSTIHGDASLNQRPMRRIITPLTAMGARIDAREQEFPPLTIHGTELQGIRYELPIASAQVKSCVLLAGLMAQGRTSVIEPQPSRDHTERALPSFGAPLAKQGPELSVEGDAHLHGADLEVPGDFSAAVYFILAALLVPGGEVRLPGVGVNPTRTGLLQLLEEAGARIERAQYQVSNGEPRCDLIVRYTDQLLQQFPREIGGRYIPNLIDEIPALAVLGVHLKHGLTVRDADELRRKESDRIRSIVVNLQALGVAVEERSDGFRVPPGQRMRGGPIRTFGDHRIAMSFTIAGLISERPVELDQPECTIISFPGFFERLEAIVR